MDALVESDVRRDCPTCGKPIMAEATLCGFCWAKVTPLTADGRAAAAAEQVAPAGANGSSPDADSQEYPEIVRRDCPHCRRRIAVDATLCGFCWSKVVPL